MDEQTVFSFFFITMGPIKLILPFLAATANADWRLRRAIALRTFLISTVVVVVLAIFGDELTSRWGISRAGISITGSVILFVWSLTFLLAESTPPKPSDSPEPPTLEMAAFPLTIPATITPAGVAAILYFTMTSPPGDLKVMAVFISMLVAVMILNLVSMLGARWILKAIGGPVTLRVAGAVLAVLQASLAIEVLIRSIQRLT